MGGHALAPEYRRSVHPLAWHCGGFLYRSSIPEAESSDSNVESAVNSSTHTATSRGYLLLFLLNLDRGFRIFRAMIWRPPSLRLRRDIFCEAKNGGKGIRTPDFQLAKLALYQLSYAPVLMIAKCGLSIGGCKEQSVGDVGAPSARQRSYPGNLSANTSAFSICGGCARRSGAFSIKALATFPDRCASRPASSGNASKMAKVVGPSLIPNQAVVAGSCCTNPCASRKNFATSFSLPGFASSLTNNAFVVMW